MGGSFRILWRFVSVTLLISFFLLILNFYFLGWVFPRKAEHSTHPDAVVRTVAEGLSREGDRYVLDRRAGALLEKNDAWAMLIDRDGRVVWDRSLPEDLPRSYSIADVARFSRYYLMDYPVFSWEHGEGLVVVGYPKGSLGKYMHVLPADGVRELLFRIPALLLGNIALALVLALLVGWRFIRSVRPLIQGIHDLAKERIVHVAPKGVFRDLARSINQASLLLQAKNKALKERDEARSNWIAGISHDVRTPLSMVLGYASELEENEALPRPEREKARIIRRQGEKLRNLINDLNLVSMLEYEMQPLKRKRIKLSALARRVVSDVLNEGLEEKYALELEVADRGAIICGDEGLLLRALNNLVHNSIRHNPEGCRILVHTAGSPDRSFCSIRVSDDGKGIPPDHLPDVTQLPYSSRRKRPAPHGHGLGLPMVARIAKAHQGKLVLRSEPGRGLTAEILLPRLDSGPGA